MLRLLGINEVKRRAGVKSSQTIQARINDAGFPSPIMVGVRTRRWVEHEVEAWVQSMVSERDIGYTGVEYVDDDEPSISSPLQDALNEPENVQLMNQLCANVNRVRVWSDIISVRRKVAEDTLLLASAKGVDYFQNLRDKRDEAAFEVVDAAARLSVTGFNIKRMETYQRWAGGDYE